MNESFVCPTPGLRPLLDCWPLLQTSLFGVSFTMFQISAFIAFLLSVLSFYVLLNHIFPNHVLFCFLVACLFMVFPTDNYRFASPISGYMSLAYALLFLSVTLLIRFSNSYRWLLLVSSVFLLLCAAALYEAVLGFAIAASGLLFLFKAIPFAWKNLTLLIPAGVAIALSLARWVSQLTGRSSIWPHL